MLRLLKRMSSKNLGAVHVRGLAHANVLLVSQEAVRTMRFDKDSVTESS